MRFDVIPKVLPGWSAATVLVKEHGAAAAGHAVDAIKAPTLAKRLEDSVRALASFDHAIDNVDKLPVKWFVPNMGTYLNGYAAAKQAVTLLVASGLVPGARERVGRQMIGAAVDTFRAGLDVAGSDTSRYGRKLATGWLDATIEDATAGALMLRDADGLELLRGLGSIRTAAAKRHAIDPTLVRRIEDLFSDATKELDSRIAELDVAASTQDTKGLTTRVDALLTTARTAAEQLSRDAGAIELVPAGSK